VHIRYRKTVGGWKDIESKFYGSDSPNDNFMSEILERLSKML
jgi:hypothetical protein